MKLLSPQPYHCSSPEIPDASCQLYQNQAVSLRVLPGIGCSLISSDYYLLKDIIVNAFGKRNSTAKQKEIQ